MTTRRSLVAGLGLIPLLAARASWAQSPAPKVARIGWLSPVTRTEDAARLNGLRHALRALGYVEGRNIAIEGSWADGRYERLDALASELVRLPVDVLVTQNTPTTQAAKRATAIIPIVMSGVTGDPVASGLVASLARPGGNITGFAGFPGDMGGKWLELLKEALPRIRRVAQLRNPATKTATARAMREAASGLKLELQEFAVTRSEELEGAFAAMPGQGIDAVVVHADSMLTGQRAAIAALAARNRLPTAGNPTLAEAGGLIGYGQQAGQANPATAALVDKILKGAKPADLPIQQAFRFTLVVNARTAKSLGIAIPQALLLREDRVIE